MNKNQGAIKNRRKKISNEIIGSIMNNRKIKEVINSNQMNNNSI